MTTISAVMRRDYTPSMFADLTDVPHTRAYVKPVSTLTFADDLDQATVDAIWARMESKDDADQARRAALRAAAASLPADNATRLAICYLLGDQ